MDRLLRTSQEAISPSAMRSDTRPKAPAAAAIGTRKQGNKEINKEIKKDGDGGNVHTQRDANIYKARGRCLSAPGAVLNL